MVLLGEGVGPFDQAQPYSQSMPFCCSLSYCAGITIQPDRPVYTITLNFKVVPVR